MLQLRRIIGFAGVSGAGLCLDYAVYSLLCASGAPAGWANLVSAGLGVTFVFAVSARRVFEAGDRFLLGLFAAYAGYQLGAIAAASWLVGELVHALDGRYLLGKALVLPLTFGANYAFMSWLFGARRRAAEPATA